jgi:ATP-binding cassette, subfamily B (MDR/TAP), member 7
MHYVWPPGPENSPLRRKVVLSMSLLLASKLATVQVPFLFKAITDDLNLATDPTHYIPLTLLLGYGIARITSSAFKELQNSIFSSVAQRAIRLVSRDIFRHLHALELQFHLDRQTGALQRVIDRGSKSINFVLTSLVFNVAPTILEIALVSSIFAYQCGWQYSAVTIGTMVAYIYSTIAITTWRTEIRKQMLKLENEAANNAVDSLLNYETVANFNLVEHQVKKYDSTLEKLDLAAIKTQTSLSLLNFTQSAIFSLGLTSVMVMASFGITQGTMTIGDLVLVNGLLFQLSIPLNFVGMVYREVRQGLVDMSAMFKLLDTVPKVKNEPDAKELIVPFKLHETTTQIPSIEFKNVSFSYPNNDRKILDNLSFQIPIGSTCAFVGPSGCGKSTIIRLLTRFYDINSSNDTNDSPSISVYGQNIRSVTLESLRKQIAVIPQDTSLFNDTIEANISFGNVEASKGEIHQAAVNAQLDHVIKSFPKQYDTVVGERGLKLSGGEKQRVAIARAVLKNSPILLCDEATSALDTNTEASIITTLRSLKDSSTSIPKTMVVIAHRLSTIRHADRIFVLDGGSLVSSGTHDELLRDENSVYFKLWTQQQKRTEGQVESTPAA